MTHTLKMPTLNMDPSHFQAVASAQVTASFAEIFNAPGAVNEPLGDSNLELGTGRLVPQADFLERRAVLFPFLDFPFGVSFVLIVLFGEG